MEQVYAERVLLHLSNSASPKIAWPMAKYMKNHFVFFGIKSPERKVLMKQFYNENGYPPAEELEEVVLQLWEMPQRELQYTGMELLFRMKDDWKEEIIELFEKLIVTKSWWDTVDFIAVNLVGTYFQKFPEKKAEITGRWIASDNIWLQRTAILFQLKYKKETDTNLLFNYITHCSSSNEFFLKKGIGWALREFSKTEPEEAAAFINSQHLKPLSIREGSKYIKHLLYKQI